MQLDSSDSLNSFDASDSFSSLFEAARQQSEQLESVGNDATVPVAGGTTTGHAGQPLLERSSSQGEDVDIEPKVASYGMADERAEATTSNYSLATLFDQEDPFKNAVPPPPGGYQQPAVTGKKTRGGLLREKWRQKKESQKAAAEKAKGEKEAKQMGEGLQRFYDGEYHITALAGELWIADLLLVIFLYLPAHVSTLCSAGLVCKAWCERMNQVPQWRFAPTPATIRLTPAQVTRWLSQQSKATLAKTTRAQIVDRDSYLDSVKFRVVLLEQQRRSAKREQRTYVGMRCCLTPLYMLFWLIPLAGVLAMAYGFGSLHTTGLTEQGQVAAASLILGIVVGILIYLFVGYHVDRYSRTVRGRLLKRSRAVRAMTEGYVTLGIASLLVLLVGTVLVSLMQFRVSYLQDISRVPILDVPACNFDPPVTKELPYQVLPFVYRFTSSNSAQDTGTDFLGYSYNYSQQVLNFNGTNFTLLTSTNYSVSHPRSLLRNCADSCDCSVAVLGNLQPMGWWENATNHVGEGTEVFFRSYRGGRFIATPNKEAFTDTAVTTSQVLWNKYRIPVISSSPATKLQLPLVQQHKWERALAITFAVLVGVFLLASTVFTCRTKGNMEVCIGFWTVILVLCCNVVMIAVWGAVCYWTPKQEDGLMPDYCMMSESSAQSMFIVGVVLLGLGICKAVEDQCND